MLKKLFFGSLAALALLPMNTKENYVAKDEAANDFAVGMKIDGCAKLNKPVNLYDDPIYGGDVNDSTITYYEKEPNNAEKQAELVNTNTSKIDYACVIKGSLARNDCDCYMFDVCYRANVNIKLVQTQSTVGTIVDVRRNNLYFSYSNYHIDTLYAKGESTVLNDSPCYRYFLVVTSARSGTSYSEYQINITVDYK